MTTTTDAMARIADRWERIAAANRADAVYHRARGNLTAAAICDAEASMCERHARELRSLCW